MTVIRVPLGSSVRRVKLAQPKDVPPAVAYEHIYRELIIAKTGGEQIDNSLPGHPDVGVPGHPDNTLPGDIPGIDNSLPALPVGGWPGCPGAPDNTLPAPPVHPDQGLPGDQPSVGHPLPPVVPQPK